MNEEPPNVMLSPSNVNAKRKRVGKRDKKYGIVDKLQWSFDYIVDVLNRVSNTTVTKLKLEDLYSYDKCLSLLNDVPNLMKGSYLYFLAMRILTVKDNQVAFYTSWTMIVRWPLIDYALLLRQTSLELVVRMFNA